MVFVLPGVEVSSNKPVKIFLRDDERRHTLDWVITVIFEVMENKHSFYLITNTRLWVLCDS